MDIKALEKKAIPSEDACAQATKDHDAVVETMQSTIEELKKLDSAASECVESFNEVQAAEEAKKAEVSAAAAALAAAQKRCKTLRGEFDKYQQNFDVLADKLGKVQHEITAWDAKIKALKDEAESQHTFIQNIMEDKQETESSSTEAEVPDSVQATPDTSSDDDSNAEGVEASTVDEASKEFYPPQLWSK